MDIGDVGGTGDAGDAGDNLWGVCTCSSSRRGGEESAGDAGVGNSPAAPLGDLGVTGRGKRPCSV